MLVVIPILNRKEIVALTDIDEPSDNDPDDEWDAETFYEKGSTIRQDSEIWTAKYDNIGISPNTQMRAFWESQGYVNRYAFLSGKGKTYCGGSKSFDIIGTQPGQIEPADCDTIGFFGLEGFTLDINWLDDAGQSVHLETADLSESCNAKPPGTVFFTSQYHRIRSVIYHYDNAVPLRLHVDIYGETGLVSIGGFCAGKAVYTGLTQVGSDISMTQQIVGRRSSNGLLTRDVGRSVIRHSLIVTCPSDNLDLIMDLYDGLAGIPTMYRMTAGFEYHWIYGCWISFSFLYSNGDLSYYTVEIETVKYPETLPDGYNMQQLN